LRAANSPFHFSVQRSTSQPDEAVENWAVFVSFGRNPSRLVLGEQLGRIAVPALPRNRNNQVHDESGADVLD
jgi:hypothetical protein